MGRPRTALLAAGGTVGRLVAAALDDAGQGFVPVGRDGGAVAAGVAGRSCATAPQVVDPRDERGLRALLAGVDVVVAPLVAGPAARAAVAAAVEAGTHLVGATSEPAHHRWARETWGTAAQAAGVAVVPGAAADLLPGDLLAALAAAQVTSPREVHVAYAVPTGLRGALTPAGRRQLADLLGRPVETLVDGVATQERLAASRRLAWFPRPVGPHHAAAVPGAEPVTVPVHLPDVRTVRTYLAMRSTTAELVQLAGNAAGWPAARRFLAARVAAGGRRDTPGRRQRARWACVVEAAGPTQVGRAWAYGHDPVALTAASLAAVTLRLLSGAVPPGVRTPAELGPAGDLLDDLAGRTDLRWGRRVTARPAD